MEASGSGAVETKAAKKQDARDRVRGLGQTGAGQVVVHEALGQEPVQEPLDNAMFQV
jgi:hypothetical protein